MRRSIATLATTVLALAVPVAARADWSPPQRIAEDISVPSCCGDLAFTGDGRAATLWSEASDEAHTQGLYLGFRLPTRGLDGNWRDHARSPGRHSTAVEPLQLALARDGGLIVFGGRLRFTTDYQDATGLAARFGHLTATGFAIDGTQRLLGRESDDSPAFAANADGDAVAAWSMFPDAPSGSNFRHGEGVFARLREPGGRFGKIRRLARRRAASWSMAAAMGRHGETAVVWRQRTKILARIAPPGEPFGGRLKVGTGNGTPSVAAGPRGETIVAWTRNIGHRHRVELDAARSQPGGVYGPVTRISRRAGRGQLVTAFDRAGRALVGWHSVVGGHPRPGAARTHLTTVGATGLRTVTVARGHVSDIAVSASGAVAVVATGAAGVRVGLRSASGAWTDDELASSSHSSGPADGASIAFDPLTDQPAVVYQVQRQPFLAVTDDAFAVERIG